MYVAIPKYFCFLFQFVCFRLIFLLLLLRACMCACVFKCLAFLYISSGAMETPGPSCSKLTTSLVNDSLKCTSSDMQIC